MRLDRASKPQPIAVEHKHQRNVHGYDERRYLASGIGRWRGEIPGGRRVLARHGIDLRAVIFQPNPLDSFAQSYQGGAVVTLDFALEVERPKAAGSTCPTTT